MGDTGTIEYKANLFALDPARFFFDPTAYNWRFAAEVGGVNFRLEYDPVLAGDRIYLTGRDERKILGISIADGSLQFVKDLSKKPEAQPIASPDQRLMIPTDKHLYALNGDGSLHFDFAAHKGKFESTPLISADGETVYAGADKTLYAINMTDGSLRWQYSLQGKLKVTPSLDMVGNIVIGSDKKDVVIIDPMGNLVTRMNLNDKFAQAVSLDMSDHSLLVRAGDKNLITVGNMSEVWDGRPDAEPSGPHREWQLSNAVAIDVGADVVHETRLPNGKEITGEGVTVAVVDSGVYFSDKVRDLLGSELNEQFLGQVDFTRAGICVDGGTQQDTYCFSTTDQSVDPYGHGSHVAGIIWSQITDYRTGAFMGIAPEANILSVRVLGEMVPVVTKMLFKAFNMW